jgi:ribosomal protein S18 acetylase RimI-like enzyme
MLSESTIQSYEERGFNAWPALQTVNAGGWLLRFAQGHTRRANSVNAAAAAPMLDGIVDFAAGLYRQHGLPLVFRVTPLVPDAFDTELERQDFRLVDPVWIMTRDLDLPLAYDQAVILSDRPDSEWLEGVAQAGGLNSAADQAQRAILAAQRVPTVFAALLEDGMPLAYGMAVYERGAVGLFAIVTLPHARRRGASRRLCRSLLAWGLQRGAQAAYLQVEVSNHAALALYQQMGFTPHYRYHYRMRA